jgi:1-acyl-sn-glycerol-3-phosphate acyltransferase
MESYTENGWWEYEPPPSVYDMVQNNLITRFFRSWMHIFLRLYLKYFYSLTFYKNEILNTEAPFFLTSNHASHFDTFVLFSAFPLNKINSVRSIAAKDYFFSNTIFRIVSHIMANMIPVSREKMDFVSISMIKGYLDKKNIVIVYPEGTRTRTGEMNPFKAGLGYVISKTCKKVVPAYIDGAYEVLNYKRKIPKRAKIRVYFGEPVEFKNCKNTKEGWKKITDLLYDKVLELKKKMELEI